MRGHGPLAGDARRVAADLIGPIKRRGVRVQPRAPSSGQSGGSSGRHDRSTGMSKARLNDAPGSLLAHSGAHPGSQSVAQSGPLRPADLTCLLGGGPAVSPWRLQKLPDMHPPKAPRILPLKASRFGGRRAPLYRRWTRFGTARRGGTLWPSKRGTSGPLPRRWRRTSRWVPAEFPSSFLPPRMCRGQEPEFRWADPAPQAWGGTQWGPNGD